MEREREREREREKKDKYGKVVREKRNVKKLKGPTAVQNSTSFFLYRLKSQVPDKFRKKSIWADAKRTRDYVISHD